MILTHADKERIRNSPCSNCHKRPPFGRARSRCHPHRLNPKLGYVQGNVIPLCPYCHGDVHPTKRRWIRSAAKGKGGEKVAALDRADAIRQYQRREFSRKGGRIGGRATQRRRRKLGLDCMGQTPEQHRDNARKGGATGAGGKARAASGKRDARGRFV